MSHIPSQIALSGFLSKVASEAPRGHFVYILEAIGINKVKIGYTSNFPHRYSTIQTNCPVTLNLWGVIPASRGVEKVLHKHFIALNSKHTSNILGKSEWFYINEWFINQVLTFVLHSVKYTLDTAQYVRFEAFRVQKVTHFGVNFPSPREILEQGF